MKTSITILICLALVGCGFSYSGDIAKAQELCRDNGGVAYIFSEMWGYDVRCKNGAEFSDLEKNYEQ